MLRPPRAVVRRDAGLYRFEQTLHRRGFPLVAGVDEAGRGACAGPLAAAAVVLPERAGIDGLADSKLLTPKAREALFDEIMSAALASTVVLIPPEEVDRFGLHVCNLQALRRAVALLPFRPDYVLIDGFRVEGLPTPSLAIWKGDEIAACVAAASIVAKVTRDRLMVELDLHYPVYQFSQHKGYVTAAHAQALHRHGPSDVHRKRYANVAAAERAQMVLPAQSCAEQLPSGQLPPVLVGQHGAVEDLYQ